MPPPADRRRRTRRDPTLTMTPEAREAYRRAEAAQTPISEMGLPVRVVNALEEADLILCAHLLRMGRESLVAIPNFGDKTMELVEAAVRRLGLAVPAAWRHPAPPPRRPGRTR